MARKTTKMVTVEERFEEPLETILPPMITEKGMSATAKELNVSLATLSYWVLKLGIVIITIALAPDERIEIIRIKRIDPVQRRDSTPQEDTKEQTR
ncbi:hypothetical protein IID24_00245 [Patescibacteria group bacterium]|nr:hypothetical protein [Patescibacteria group bacterium]